MSDAQKLKRAYDFIAASLKEMEEMSEDSSFSRMMYEDDINEAKAILALLSATAEPSSANISTCYDEPLISTPEQATPVEFPLHEFHRKFGGRIIAASEAAEWAFNRGVRAANALKLPKGAK